jgi:hypothetical protein
MRQFFDTIITRRGFYLMSHETLRQMNLNEDEICEYAGDKLVVKAGGFDGGYVEFLKRNGYDVFSNHIGIVIKNKKP